MKKRYNLPSLYSSSKLVNGLGLGILRDVVEATVIEERNGMYELELGVKKTGFLVDKIKIGSIIKANASKSLRNQLFRVYNIKKSDNDNIIWIYAEHIFFDLRNNFVRKYRADNIGARNGLLGLLESTTENTDFYGHSDITHTANLFFERKNALECIVGSEGSFVDSYGNGAELRRDNYRIELLKKRGRDNNVLVSYKKNILGFDCVEDNSDLCTKIYPYMTVEREIESTGDVGGGYSQIIDETIEIDGLYIEADNVNDFDIQYIKAVDFTNDSFWDSYEKNKDNLKILASKYFNKTKCNIPKFKFKINFIALSDTEEYKDLAFLEDVDLCDYVNVWHSQYNVKEKVRVDRIKFDVLRNRIIEIELNNETSTIHNGNGEKFDEIKNIISNNKSEMEKVIEKVTQQITGNDGGFVKLYPPDRPSEIFILDVDDVNNAKNVMRINKNGIGFSKNGLKGKYETAWSCDGTFYANWIQAGVMSANLIKAGVLSNINDTISIDLENGNSIIFRKNSNRALEINGSTLKFYDFETNGAMLSGEIFAGRMVDIPQEKTITITNMIDSMLSLGYRDGSNTSAVSSYIMFDKYNKRFNYPINVFEETSFNGNVLMNTNNLYFHPSKIMNIWRGSDGYAYHKGDLYGMKLTDKNNYLMMMFDHSGEITVGGNYFYNSIPLTQDRSVKVYNNGNELILKGDSGVRCSIGGYYLADFFNNGFNFYRDLNMKGYSISNANIVSSISNLESKSYKEVNAMYSFNDEISSSFTIRGKKDGVRINLNNTINYDKYIVNCTPDKNVKVWVKKFDDYCMVFAEDDCEIDLMIIYKVLKNEDVNILSVKNTMKKTINKDEEIDSEENDSSNGNDVSNVGFSYEIELKEDKKIEE